MFNDKRRGDIWWAQDTAHKREDTCLIRGGPTGGDRQQRRSQLQHAHHYGGSPDLQPGAAGPRRWHLRSGSFDGAPSMALTRQVHAVDTDDLTEYRGHLTDADMLRLDAVLRRALGV